MILREISSMSYTFVERIYAPLHKLTMALQRKEEEHRVEVSCRSAASAELRQLRAELLEYRETAEKHERNEDQLPLLALRRGGRLLDPLHGGLRFGFSAAGDHHGCPGLEEGPSRVLADARGRAGHDDQLAVEALAEASGDLICRGRIAVALCILARDAAPHLMDAVPGVRHHPDTESEELATAAHEALGSRQEARHGSRSGR